MYKLVLASQKGGVGKTTTAVNLAYYFAVNKGLRTLLLDFDVQGQSSTSLGVARGPNSAEMILRHNKFEKHPSRLYQPTENFIIRDIRPNLDVVPGNPELSFVEHVISNDTGRELILQRRLEEVQDQYAMCIIDLGPHVNVISTLTLFASNSVMIPLQPGALPRDGLEDLIHRLQTLQGLMGYAPAIAGIFANMLDMREKLSKKLVAFMEEVDPAIRAPSIKKGSKLAEAPEEGKSIFEYAPTSESTKEFVRLAEWTLERIQQLK